jgi:gluconolactonase
LIPEVNMRVLAATSLCLLAVAPLFGADELRPTGDPKILDPDARLELLFTRSAPLHGGLTEGPTVAPDGSIYFSDIPVGEDKGMILRYDPRRRETTILTDDSHKSNGLKFDADGRLVACEGSDGGGRCVSRWDVHTRRREVLADRTMGKRFNAPNDLSIDLKGRIYFTDPRYLGTEPRELEHRAVYRLDKDGTVREVTHEPEKPNGIVLSPDQKTLYVIDHNNGTDRIDPTAPPPKEGAMTVVAFPLGDDGLVKGPPRTVIDFAPEKGADGMAVDMHGNLYLAVRSLKRPGIWVLDPSGKELGYIPTGTSQPEAKEPKGIPSNCTFGLGDEIKTLYVTVDTSLYRIRLKAEGWHIPFTK